MNEEIPMSEAQQDVCFVAHIKYTELVEIFDRIKKSPSKVSLAKINLQQAMLWFRDALSDEFAPEVDK